jgi:hypothetical protein
MSGLLRSLGRRRAARPAGRVGRAASRLGRTEGAPAVTRVEPAGSIDAIRLPDTRRPRIRGADERPRQGNRVHRHRPLVTGTLPLADPGKSRGHRGTPDDLDRVRSSPIREFHGSYREARCMPALAGRGKYRRVLASGRIRLALWRSRTFGELFAGSREDHRVPGVASLTSRPDPRSNTRSGCSHWVGRDRGMGTGQGVACPPPASRVRGRARVVSQADTLSGAPVFGGTRTDENQSPSPDWLPSPRVRFPLPR